MTASWFSLGWTKIWCGPGATVCGDEYQIGVIAKEFGTHTVGVSYRALEETVSFIEASAHGLIVGHTALTSVLTEPRGDIWNPAIAADPTPAGITKALAGIGFDVEAHMLPKSQIVTINTIY